MKIPLADFENVCHFVKYGFRLHRRRGSLFKGSCLLINVFNKRRVDLSAANAFSSYSHVRNPIAPSKKRYNKRGAFHASKCDKCTRMMQINPPEGAK